MIYDYALFCWLYHELLNCFIHTTNPWNDWSNPIIRPVWTTRQFPYWHSRRNRIRDRYSVQRWDNNLHGSYPDWIPMDSWLPTFSVPYWRHFPPPRPYKRRDHSSCNLSFLERMVYWLNQNNEYSIILPTPVWSSSQSIDSLSFQIVRWYSQPIHVGHHRVWSVDINKRKYYSIRTMGRFSFSEGKQSECEMNFSRTRSIGMSHWYIRTIM